MSTASDDRVRHILEQSDRRSDLIDSGESPWTTLYESWRESDANGGRFSALAPKRLREKLLAHDGWDLIMGGGLPGFIEYWQPKKRRKYFRFGDDDGLEPLVIIQDHHGIRPEMLPQLNEEFRLYHNLWINPEGTELFKVNLDGTDELVAEIAPDLVQVRTKYLRQFQAGRQADIYLYIDSIQFVDDPSESTNLEGIGRVDVVEDLHLTLEASDHVHGPKRPFSRLLGKKLLDAPPQAKAGIWPFDEGEETFHEFIIDEDGYGDPVKNTCDPERLANYFGKNPDAPHYLTPVYFQRDVLQRYYERPEKYSVSDGLLTCGNLWSLRIDNDHPQHVMVFLGDLGRDLPESERPYWQTFNIAPSGGPSATVIKRSFYNQPTNPEAPDLRFKYIYGKFRYEWRNEFGWDLFKEPVLEDEHVLQRLRVPLNDSQPEFEDQVLGLAKVLVDSLDEKAIVNQLPHKVQGEKGIGKLERYLKQEEYPYAQRDLAFLRRLQRLRSKLAAHRKGSDYKEVLTAAQVDEDVEREVVKLFLGAIALLSDLGSHVGLDLDGM